MVAVAFIMLLEYYKPDQMDIVCCECMHACVCVFEIVYWHFIRHYLHCGVYHLITNVLLLSTRHVEKQKLFGLSVCLCVCGLRTSELAKSIGHSIDIQQNNYIIDESIDAHRVLGLQTFWKDDFRVRWKYNSKKF